MPRGISAAHHRANRSADHDIRHDAVSDQRLDDPDMRKAAGRTAAEREPDYRPPDGAQTYLVAVIGAVLLTPPQIIEHEGNLLKEQARLQPAAESRQKGPQACFMPRLTGGL